MIEIEHSQNPKESELISTEALDKFVGKFATLSSQQQRVAILLGQGIDAKTIALRFNNSTKTIASHRTAIYQKLSISSETELARILTAAQEQYQLNTKNQNYGIEVTEEEILGLKNKIKNLSNAEKKVFDLLALGYNSESVANNLGIAPQTVKVHKTAIFNKLSFPNHIQLIRVCTAMLERDARMSLPEEDTLP